MDLVPERLHRTAGCEPATSLSVASAAKLAVEGLLDSLHGVEVLLLCSAFLHLLGIQVLQACLNPPEVALRVPHAPDPITEEEVRHLGHGGGPGLQRSPIYSIAILDVQAEEARRARPLLFASNAITIESPIRNSACPMVPSSLWTRYLLRTKRLSNEI